MKPDITLDTIRRIGLALPGVEESTAFGAFALKAGGKMFACTPTNRSAEPGSLLLRVGLDRRAEMLDADPETYYITPHYADYPSVLVRLSRVKEDMLRDLLAMAHRFVSQKTKPRGRK